jgi:hypothetical protein
MDRTRHLAVLTVFVLFPVRSIVNWSYDVERTKSNGEEIVAAILKYREQNNQLPRDLRSLVPRFLKEVPPVERTLSFLPDKAFEYSLYNVIPFPGCFSLTFMHKRNGLTYRYDSRNDSIIYAMIGTHPRYIEEDITFKDIHQLKDHVLAYYKDSLEYPASLNDLIPEYMDAFPFDTAARYRPYDIAPDFSAELLEYQYHQPCDTFRGNYRLIFKVTYGRYIYNTYTNAGGWGYDDD